MKKTSIFIFIVIILMTCVFAGCGSAEALVPGNDSPENIAPIDTPNAPVEIIDLPPVEDINAELSNVWSLMDNECVEEIPFLPGLLIDDFEEWKKTSEFKEIILYQRTEWDTVRLGEFGDMAVAQLCMDDEDLVWNVRMEKANGLENRTPIEIPEDADVSVNPIINTNTTETYYFWENDDGTCIQLYLVYFPETHNLYTIYTDGTVFTSTGSGWTSNSNRSPTVMLHEIPADKGRYDYPEDVALIEAQNTMDIRYFRIKMLSEYKTYQFRFGTTLAQWIYSEYNTDGWKIDPKDPYIIVSADGRFKLPAENYVWRTMRAELHGGIPTEETIENPYFDYCTALGVTHNSELGIRGFYLHSETFSTNDWVEFTFAGYPNTYGVNDNITFSGINVSQEDVENLEVYVISHTPYDKTIDDIENDPSHKKDYGWPYGNDLNTIRSKGTKLELEYREFNELNGDVEFFERMYEKGAFVTTYRPQDDPKFSDMRDVDICIIYKGEIAYWIFLPQFYYT